MPIPDPDIYQGDAFYAELFRGTGSVLEDPMMRDACRAFQIGNMPMFRPQNMPAEFYGDMAALEVELQSAFRAKWHDRLQHADPYSAQARAIPPTASQRAPLAPQAPAPAPAPRQETPTMHDPYASIRADLRAKGFADDEIQAAIDLQPNGRRAPARAESHSYSAPPAPAPMPRAAPSSAHDPEVERRLLAKGYSRELIAEAMALPVTIVRDLGETP